MPERTVAKAVAPQTSEVVPAHRPESASSPSHVMRLQRSVGNREIGYLVQTRLLVGPHGDRYEQEAEAVAEQVMGMHHEPAETSEAPGQVQRACVHCGQQRSDDDWKIQRKCTTCEHEEEEKARLSPQAVKPPSETAAAHSAPLNEHELRTGGDPMPDPVRHFFEARFSRDFRDVRVHTGAQAEQYNEGLHAYGFTFGNHIWLGRGHQAAPSLLMAHELAHVVQQHRPPRIRGGRNYGQGLHQDREPVVRRWEPYWEGKKKPGEDNHKLILPAMGEKNSIFTEAPVPHAKTSKAGYFGEPVSPGSIGQVDLYRASTTVGVYFLGHGRPAPLRAGDLPRTIMKGGVRYEHNNLSAPQVENGALVKSANAPTKIEIGDLKPNSTFEAYHGTFQLKGYMEGYLDAHKEARDKATPGDGKDWNLPSASVKLLSDLAIPDKYKPGSFSGQDPRPLVIMHLGKPRPTKGTVLGQLAVWESKNFGGIWLYGWVPTTVPTAAQLPAKIRSLDPQLKQRIIDPLLESPVQPKKKSKPGPAPAPEPVALTGDTKPMIRRLEAVAPEKDNFDYKKWQAGRKEISEEYGEEKKTGEFKEAESEIMGNRAYEHLRRSGLQVTEIAAVKESGQTVSKLDFWTGAGGAVLGLLRKVFGRAFVAVAQFFIKMRDKVRALLKKMKTTASPGGGFLGAALKASFKVLKLIAGFVIGKVANRLMQSLITGVGKKLTEWIGPENMEELEQKKEQMEKIRDDIEAKISDTADQLLEKLFGVHLKDIEKLRETYEFIRDYVAPLISLVRWGVRVIECLSPPAFGCLWILAEAAADFILQKLAETCWFQKKIQPIIAKVKYVTTDIPNMLGDGIIGKLKDILPKSLGDMFADLETGEIKPTAEETGCDEDSDKTEYHPDPLHDEIEELYKKIGPERADALGLLVSKMSNAAKKPLTSDDLKKLGEELMKVAPEQLQKYAEHYPGGSEGVPGDLSKLVDQINQTPPPGGTAGQPTTPPPAPPPPPADADKGNQDAGGGSKPPEKKDNEPEASEGGGLAVADAATRKSEDVPHSESEDLIYQVMNPNTTLHTKGAEPKVDVLVWFKREAKVLERNVETLVTRRPLFPTSAKSLDDALALDIKYRVKYTYTIDEIPGAIIPRNKELTGRVLTSSGQKLLAQIHKQQAESHAKK